MSDRAAASLLLKTPGALLSRSHLVSSASTPGCRRDLRALDVVVLPGTAGLFFAEDYLELLRRSTYSDDRVPAA